MSVRRKPEVLLLGHAAAQAALALPRETGRWHVYVTDLLDGKLYVLYDWIMLWQQGRRKFRGSLRRPILVGALMA